MFVLHLTTDCVHTDVFDVFSSVQMMAPCVLLANIGTEMRNVMVNEYVMKAEWNVEKTVDSIISMSVEYTN